MSSKCARVYHGKVLSHNSKGGNCRRGLRSATVQRRKLARDAMIRGLMPAPARDIIWRLMAEGGLRRVPARSRQDHRRIAESSTTVDTVIVLARRECRTGALWAWISMRPVTRSAGRGSEKIWDNWHKIRSTRDRNQKRFHGHLSTRLTAMARADNAIREAISAGSPGEPGMRC